jgi:hypothetical protein
MTADGIFFSELKYYLPGSYCVDVMLSEDDYVYQDGEDSTRKKEKNRRIRKEDFSLMERILRNVEKGKLNVMIVNKISLGKVSSTCLRCCQAWQFLGGVPVGSPTSTGDFVCVM